MDTTSRWYRHAGGAMLRAAAIPLTSAPEQWPALADPDSCRSWLRTAWAVPGFADATTYASTSLARTVRGILADEPVDEDQVRRATRSVLRYLLRTVGRPTPFGLFAGVAPVRVDGTRAAVAWGQAHRSLIRADTLWLDGLIEQLEASPGLLPHLRVLYSDLAIERGDRVEVPRGPARVKVRNTLAVRLVRDAAATPIAFSALCSKVVEAFPDVPSNTVHKVLSSLVAHGILVTNLRAPMTVTDPLAYLIEVLERDLAGAASDQAAAVVAELGRIQYLIREHNAAHGAPAEQVRLRAAATDRMKLLSTEGRTTLAGDLHLDCRTTVPTGLADAMADAVTALVQLTRQPHVNPAWNQWCLRFWDRYGTGALVPVTDAIHPDTGIGLPAGYPASMLAPPNDSVTHRDQELLKLAWDAVTAGHDEVVLTDETVAAVTAEQPVDPRFIPPHVELGARVHASSIEAFQAGDYTFTVHPARAFGTLTSRFGPAVPASGLAATYATAPPGVDGALSVQMSFPPLFPHGENIARLPRFLPYVLPLGEHRPIDEPNLIRLDDLAIVAVADGLHLVSISRRQPIDPQVFHPLALEKQAPPLARFLAMLTRGFATAYTAFDWGPAARRLAYLPRIRYRRAILSPATWRPPAEVLTGADDETWRDALTRWREQHRCPTTIELHDDHRSLRLNLSVPAHQALLRQHLDNHRVATMTEAEPVSHNGWIGEHTHEIVMPFARQTPPAPNLVTGSLPLVTNSLAAHLPGSAHASWLYAQIFTHPERIDDILTAHLPQLLADLDGHPEFWFARYRSEHETDHLRLRIGVANAEEYARTAMAVGRWAQQLSDTGTISRLTLATYHPEVGRYGSGPTLQAAESVFAADSHAVALGLRTLAPSIIHPTALTAIGMVEIVDHFHADREAATSWLLGRRPEKVPADRAAADQAARWSAHGLLPDGTALPPLLAEAWDSRRAALAEYRRRLSDDDADRVLAALVHMHHNRARLVDRDDEAVCLRLARGIAVVRRARATA